MNQNEAVLWPINQLFIFVTGFLILLLVMKFASSLIAPFLIAVALSIILAPTLSFFERKKIPRILSLIVIFLLFLLPLLVLGGYIGSEVKDFSSNFSEISQKFNVTLEKFAQTMERFGIQVKHKELEQILANSNVGDIVKNLATQAGSQFSNIFLIFFMLAFMLMESKYFYNKMLKLADENGKDVLEWMNIIEKIKSYFSIKVKTSLFTALWVLSVLWFYDVNYFYLWATLAFVLNFIPVIGSILAAIPPIIMAMLDQGMMTSLWVALWYLIINTVVGNILEPKIMGKGLGISALIIFLSMTFWGWIFGPTGMILSVPLTMIFQFFFSQYEETKWISLMLSDYETPSMKEKMLKKKVLLENNENNKKGE